MHLEPDTIEQQVNPFAGALEPVWDKVRTAAALMASLRQEKAQLEARVAGLEEEVRQNKELSARQAAELARLKSQVDSFESSTHTQIQHPVVLGPEERVQLQNKIKTALTKIDAHLSAS
jgi:chromosome segregation ATPase